MTRLMLTAVSARPVRFLVYPAVGCVALVMVFAAPEPAATGADVANWADLSDEAMADESRKLEGQRAVVEARIEYKEALLAELAAGRTTLPAVAAAFLRVNQDDAVCLGVVQTHYPGRSDEEKSARNVLDYASGRVMPAGPKAAFLARLAAEFAAAYPAAPADLAMAR